MIEYTESDDRLHYTFRGRTKKTFAQFKQDATRELDSSWASFAVSYVWKDRSVEISSAGANGTGRIDEEQGVIAVDLHLTGWPATLPYFKDKIVSDVRRMTEVIVETSTLQRDENNSRVQICTAARKRLDDCRHRERAAGASLRRWQVFDDVTRVLVAVTGTGTAFALWAQSASERIRPFAILFVSLTAVLSTLQAALRVSDQIKGWSEIQGHFVRLRHDFETFLEQAKIKDDFSVGEFQQRLEALERRHADGAVMWRTDLLSTIDGMWSRRGAAEAVPEG